MASSSCKQQTSPWTAETRAERIFRQHLTRNGFSTRDGHLEVVNDLGDLRLDYVSEGDFETQVSQSHQHATYLRMRIDPQAGYAWIGELQIARHQRHQGKGKQLVSVAEEIAIEFSGRTLHVFPLFRAVGFWRKMGYSPHPRMARAFTKQLEPP